MEQREVFYASEIARASAADAAEVAHPYGGFAGPVGRTGDLGSEIASLYGALKRRQRVLLFGNYGRGNLGDEGILAAILDALEPVADVTVVSRAPKALASLHQVRSVKMMSLRGLFALLRCNHVAIGGGGMFGNGINIVTSMLPVIAWIAQKLGKPTVFLATGAYSSSPSWVQRCLRIVASQSLFVSVRDLESAAVLAHGPATVIVDDPAITLAPAAAGVGRTALADAGIRLDRPLLGLSLKPTHYQDRNEAQIAAAAAACRWWRETLDGDCVLLVLSGHGDNGVAVSDQTLLDAVAAQTSTLGGIHQLGPNLSPEVLKAAIGQLQIVIGHRLHAQIYAWSMGVPVVGISYERKSDSFLEARRLRRIDLWALEPSVLVEVLSALPHDYLQGEGTKESL
jgi:polysaccharide pyruvyl transferase WcaK-like protein